MPISFLKKPDPRDLRRLMALTQMRLAWRSAAELIEVAVKRNFVGESVQ